MKRQFLHFAKAFAFAVTMFPFFNSAQAQCTVTLSPSADAQVFGRPDAVNTNNGASPELMVGTWTWNSVQGSYRSFIRFDLSGIPANATISGATLNLFANMNAFLQQGHSNLTTSNASTITPVSAAWAENTITWSNQPGVGAGAVAVPQSAAANQNYSLNVLSMVQNMVANPANNFGFRIQQNAEATYAMLTFATKEHANTAIRPTLVVTYNVTAAPTFVTAPPASVCAGTTVNYSVNAVAGASSYKWTIDGVAVATSASPTFSKTWSASETGNHVVKVTVVRCNTVSQELVSNITVNPLPVVAAITGTTTVCVNQYTPLSDATAGGVWASSNTSVATVNNFGLVKGVSAGTANITYTVTSAAGCSTTVSTTVTVNGTLVFNINGPATVCPNTSNAYSVSPAVAGADYTWNIQNAPSVGVTFPVNGSTSTNVSVPAGLTGQFILRCQGLNSCGASQIVSKTIAVSTDVPPAPIINCSSGDNCATLSVSNSGTYAVQWIVNGVVQSTATSFVRPAGTPVLCTFTSASGCKTSTWYSPAVVCTYAARLADEIDLSDKPFLIYPNPAKGVFVIETKNQVGTASIFDISGRLVKDIPLTEMANSYKVEIGTPGIYTIHVKTDSETKGYKIVVE
jgi:hypothetical protein